MSRIIYVAFSLFGLTISNAFSQTADTQLQAGQCWATTQQDKLKIGAVADNGSFSGLFMSHTEPEDCGRVLLPVTGWMTNNFISFQLHWTNPPRDCFFITSWIGHIEGKLLHTERSVVRMNTSTFQPEITHDQDDFHLR